MVWVHGGSQTISTRAWLTPGIPRTRLRASSAITGPIPLAAAQELLAQGFLEEVLAKVGHAEAAEAVRGMLREKFHQA